MRYFQTSSASVTTVRIVGFYPSKRVAMTLATKLGYVLQLNEAQTAIVALYLHGCYVGNEAWNSFTPKEQEVVKDLLNWWVVDNDGEFNKGSFVAINLNEGRSVVIVAKQTLTLNGISFDDAGKKVTTWARATLDDVTQINSEMATFKTPASTTHQDDFAGPDPFVGEELSELIKMANRSILQ